MGVIHYLHFAAWLFVAAGMLKTWKAWKFMLMVTTAVALTADVTAIIEWWSSTTGVLRVRSFFGNSVLLSQYLVLHVFVSLMLWVYSKHFWEKMIYLLTILAHVFALIVAGSRASLLALVLAGSFGALILFIEVKGRLRLAMAGAAGISIAIVIAAGVFVYSKGSDWAYEHLPFSVTRAIYPNTLEDGSSFVGAQLGDRDNLWAIALIAFKERPISGHGLEGFREVFYQHYDPFERDVDLVEHDFDRAHNQYLEVLFSQGIIGSSVYLALIVWIFLLGFSAYKATKTGSQKIGIVFLLMLFVAHGVQQFFQFDVRSTNQVLVLMLAFLYWDTRDSSVSLIKVKNFGEYKLPFASLLLVLMLAGFVIYYANIRPAISYYWAEEATRTLQTNPDESLDLFKRSLNPESVFVYDNRIRVVNHLSTFIDLTNARYPLTEDLLKLAVAEGKKTVEAFPNRYNGYISTVIPLRQYAKWYPEDNKQELELAEDLAMKLTEYAPGRYMAFEELGEIELLRGNFEESIAWFERAKARTSTDLIDQGRMHFRMAEAELRRGNYAGVLNNMDAARQLGYSVYSDLRLIIAFNEVADYADYPPGFSLYAVELNLVGRSQGSLAALAQTYRFFEIQGDKESSDLILNQMINISGILAERTFFEVEEEKRLLKAPRESL